MKRILTICLTALLALALLTGCSGSPSTASESAEAPASEKATTEPTEEASAESSASEEAAEETAQPESSAEGLDLKTMAEEASANGDNSLSDVLDKGYFIVGLDDSFPPMGFRDENGELTGFDIELAQALAAEMGLEAQLQPIDWKAKELELDGGNIDVIWNGYTITPERLEAVLMSDPYMKNEQVVVVPADSDIKTLADLAGKKVAVQDGSSAQDAIAGDEELAGSIGEQVDFKDNVTALMDVASGQTDALAVDSVVADYYIAQRPGEFVILSETLAPEEYGIGFRKADQALHDAFAAALKQMREDGKAAELSTKWFGRDVTTF